ncbi:MAG: NAD(P)/FAD-dependent oxidoreductase [Archaeoglobaceae archaeon]|nr:NAD(P)/FAD-dependent oxidoreductase [Archaeoglobaceae archaeon]
MILVVGAGPAGCLTAILLGKRKDVLIVEEHQIPGFPVQCAGLISDECFGSYRNYCKIRRAVENEINGAFFFSPSGDFFEARGKAFVIERKILDEMLLIKASQFADISVKEKVRFRGRRAFIGEKEIFPDFVIGADGVSSEVARAFGFRRPNFFSTLQIETKFEALDENHVEIYLGKDYSEFFAYAIPIGDTAKLGVIAKKNVNLYLRKLLEKHPSVSKRVKGSVLELNSGIIPDNLVDFVKERVALIGDAAGMVKPYSGGGLYYLLVAAEKLAENFPNLWNYRNAFLKELGGEIRLGKRIRKIYWLEDEKIEGLVRALKNFDFSDLHMDHPSSFLSIKNFFKALKLFVKNPFLLMVALKVLK